MGFKHILLHIDEGPDATARREIALRLAQAGSAHLTGLYVRSNQDGRLKAGVASAELTAEIRRMAAAQSEDRQQAEREMIRQFDAAASAVGVTAEHCIESTGDGATMVSHLVRYARTSDAVVLGRHGGTDGGAALSVPHDVLFGAGVPVIFVPAEPPGDIGRRVVIAWNGSRESARAVKDALPILEQAEEVRVLCVGQQRPGSNVQPGAELARHLAHHGIEAPVDNMARNGSSVGDTILGRLQNLGADLLVMGGYGHSRLREFVLGGVTKRVLERTTIPVLMSH